MLNINTVASTAHSATLQ